ncbi:MAG: ABC transporter ATP-binding protein [Acidimicrobiales bacterium]|jgi:spermidine/putrescine transport system ATP-binding protein|nr:ABC transporter ATP-binding protein [Acidimicrobiales bacterium]HJM29302.1 ABC transporter ATP-binding protein [Acidimicrobiales bacterium]HJM97204.1 ABC transporter ATP-binding protein [Acidimicrobiales bacterium]
MTAAVELKAITKKFGDVVAVDNIDLTIEDGEFFAMLGPSGCGKTTTLRMIAGLEFPTQGSLSIFGEEVGTLAPNKRSVNTVFQNYALFPHLSVLDNVGFGLKMQGIDKNETRTRAMEMIELVQLEGLEGRKPSQMSGGQQQRVALARALVNQPKVLLLDEPLGALDLKLRQEMQLELKKLQRDVGISFVFVTHDQEEALTMSDRIAVMHEGKLLQVASPEEIYETPVNRFVADFIGRTNLLEGTVSDSETVILTNGTPIRASNDFAAGTSVSISLRPERAKITQQKEDGDPLSSVSGVVETITYLGNARVYSVKFTWMSLEVREENRPGVELYEPGTPITVSWDHDAISVVAD